MFTGITKTLGMGKKTNNGMRKLNVTRTTNNGMRKANANKPIATNSTKPVELSENKKNEIQAEIDKLTANMNLKKKEIKIIEKNIEELKSKLNPRKGVFSGFFGIGGNKTKKNK